MNYAMGKPCIGRAFMESWPSQKLRNYRISGITKDSTGAPLPGCTVEVYETTTLDNLRLVGTCVSNGGGTYEIKVNGPDTGMKFQAIAYLPGSPDVAGITVNTLVGTEL